MDWGLFCFGQSENKFLREEIVYSPGVSCFVMRSEGYVSIEKDCALNIIILKINILHRAPYNYISKGKIEIEWRPDKVRPQLPSVLE